MISHIEVQAALRAILIGVAGLPAMRIWENVYDANNHNLPFTPKEGVPYIAESYAPATRARLTTSKYGTIEVRGLYLVQWFGVAGSGTHLIRAGVDAVLGAFPPGLRVLLSNAALEVRGDAAPESSQIIPLENGFAFCTITIPWEALTYT